MFNGKIVEMLVIDPQNDFCNPGISKDIIDKIEKIDPILAFELSRQKGSLFVPGADKDMERLAKLIKDHIDIWDDIHVTLDTHHRLDISHSIFWINSKNEHPSPFTIITLTDFKKGIWRTTNPAYMNRRTMKKAGWDRDGAQEYLEKLEANGRYPHSIWPDHCLIGSWGHNVFPILLEALDEWENQFAMVDFVTKGSNFWTEHFSAVQAEVPDNEDPGTLLNTDLIQTINKADVIILPGEALSHCVANTVRDIANNFGEENIEKIILLTDATSSVSGFEHLSDAFMKEMISRGMRTSTCADLFNNI